MGAINYGKNKEFVTLGYDTRLIEEDDDAIFCQDEYEQVKMVIDDFKSDNIKVKVEGGYYEGFWISISLDVNFFWNYNDKLQTLKDVTQLKKKLLALLDDFHLLAVDSWWVSTWYTKEETIKKIHESVANLRKVIKQTPTEKTYDWKKLCK